MKYTEQIKHPTDGRLVVDYRWACEGRRPFVWDDDTEAWLADMGATDIDLPAIGTIYMIGTDEYVGPNGDESARVCASPDNGEGWCGNSDQSIKRYHGWRGTTNDWAFYGHGVRRCLAVRETGKRSRRTVIVFGRDLKAHDD